MEAGKSLSSAGKLFSDPKAIGKWPFQKVPVSFFSVLDKEGEGELGEEETTARRLENQEEGA